MNFIARTNPKKKGREGKYVSDCASVFVPAIASIYTSLPRLHI